jgi:hypothetical protein
MAPALLTADITGGNNSKGLDICSWSNISELQDWRFILHALGSHVVAGIACWMIGRELQGWVNIRTAYVQSAEYMKSIAATTVLIRPIPSWARSEMNIRKALQINANVRNVWLVKETKALEVLVQQRDSLIFSLEKVELQLMKRQLQKAVSMFLIKISSDKYFQF